VNWLLLRRRFLREIGSSEQMLLLFDLLPEVSVFLKNSEGRFMALNRLACEFCGIRSEREAVGKSDWDLFPHARVPVYLRDDEQVLTTGEPIHNRLEPFPNLRGSPALIVTNKVPLRNRSGIVVGVAGFSRRVPDLRFDTEGLERLARSVERLHRDYAQPLTTAVLAKLAGLSVSQFERTFRRILGSTPHQYLLRVRIDRACELLTQPGATVASVALDCGFYDQPHFTRAFTELLGETPSQYRASKGAPRPVSARTRHAPRPSTE
jgi:PAS domain S-box-containing protein